MPTENDPELTPDDDLNPDPEPNKKPEKKPPTPAPTTDDLPDDPEELKDFVRRTRKQLLAVQRENNERKRRQDEIERQEEERKTAALGETERLKKAAREAEEKRADAERRAAEAVATLERQQIDLEVERLANKMGYEYPDITPSLIDRRLVEKDQDTGKILGVKEALERLARERPGLLLATPRGGTPPREGPRRTGERDGRGGRGERNPMEDELRSSGKYV